uniref:Uncharacterized protein n=1 Tax=Aegilops tauschii subsp. strangulata TaxID=200361 RepID=A0A453ANJ0_AEGTS
MPKQFLLIQTKILDFFKIQRRPAAAAAEPPEGKKRKRKAASALVVSEKKSRKLPFTPSKTPSGASRRWPRSPRRSRPPAPSSATTSPTCPAWRPGPPTNPPSWQEGCRCCQGRMQRH